MMRHEPFFASVALLASLTILVLVIAAPSPTDHPACGSASALAVLPLGVDWPEARLAAYGRSAAAIRPGDVLCVALAWKTGFSVGGAAPTLHVELVGPDGQIAARYQGPAADSWGSNATPIGLVALPLNRRAATGVYLIDLSVVDKDGSPIETVDGRAAITVGTVLIDPEAPPQVEMIGTDDIRGLEFRGWLSEWPFWPHPKSTNEGDL